MATETVAVTARTSLEAMNSILALTGNSPVTDYNDTTNLDVIQIRMVIEETSLEVQEDSWDFNREYDIKWSPTNDEIVLTTVMTGTGYTPEYAGRIDFLAHKNKGKDLIIRDGKVYDKTNNTFEITHDVYVDIVWYLPWADLPNDIRYYITMSAARKFNARRQGSDMIDQMLAEQERKAFSRARAADMDRGDYNALRYSRALMR